ncbi:MAG: peptidylprolyl isomerase [Actinomycetia bacterium]|nr:peptidylprolyl isomerase [Actinomycetes bacterium]
MTSLWRRIGFGLALAAGLTACGAPTAPPPLAVVNGHAITEQDLTDAVGSLDVLQNTSLPMDSAHRKAYVAQLVDTELVLEWARQHHVGTDAAKQVSAFVKGVEAAPGGQKALEAALGSHGVTFAGFRRFLTRQFVLNAVFNQQTAHVPAPSAAAVQAYYVAHPAAYTTPRRLLVRHILVKTQAQAQSLLDQIRHGASFAALAQRYSLDRATASQGGSLGYVAEGAASGLVPHFYELMDRLKPGQYGIAHTRYGYHIVEVQAVEPGQLVPLASVAPTIKSQLWLAAKNRVFQQFVGRLHAGAHIELSSR